MNTGIVIVLDIVTTLVTVNDLDFSVIFCSMFKTVD